MKKAFQRATWKWIGVFGCMGSIVGRGKHPHNHRLWLTLYKEP